MGIKKKNHLKTHKCFSPFGRYVFLLLIFSYPYGEKTLGPKTVKTHDVSNVYLEVRPSNLAAIDLYYQAGFSKVGEWPNYYPAVDGREDAHVLNLSI